MKKQNTRKYNAYLSPCSEDIIIINNDTNKIHNVFYHNGLGLIQYPFLEDAFSENMLLKKDNKYFLLEDSEVRSLYGNNIYKPTIRSENSETSYYPDFEIIDLEVSKIHNIPSIRDYEKLATYFVEDCILISDMNILYLLNNTTMDIEYFSEDMADEINSRFNGDVVFYNDKESVYEFGIRKLYLFEGNIYLVSDYNVYNKTKNIKVDALPSGVSDIHEIDMSVIKNL